MPSPEQEFDYFIGLVLGDGNITNNKRTVRITYDAKNLSWGEEIKNSIIAIGHKPKLYLSPNKANTLAVNSTTLAKELLTYKKHIGYKKYKWSLDRIKYFNYFIAGLFDCDGCVVYTTHKTKTDYRIPRRELVFVQQNNGNLNKIIPYLKHMEIEHRVLEYPDSNRIYIYIRQIDSIKKFYNYIPIRHPDKLSKLVACIKEYTDRCSTKLERNKNICEEYDGKNLMALSKKYNLTYQGIQFILNKQRVCL